MKTKNNKLGSRFGKSTLGALCLSAALASSTSAAILAVDFHQFASNATQDGFSAFVVANDGSVPVSETFGAYTVTAAAGPTREALDGIGNIDYNTRGRGQSAVNSGAFTQEDLLRERLAATGSPSAGGTLENVDGTGNGLYIMVEGLAASTIYSVEVWGADWSGGGAAGTGTAKSGYNAIYDETADLVSLGSYTVGSGVVTVPDNNSFSVSGSITSDANGVIVFKSISNIDGSGIISGFSISAAAIPEPSAALLGLFGVLGLLGVRRR